jgi:methylenetetrahydrofolate reductase (NADPH)
MKISFEFFPPRTPKGAQNLVEVRKQLSTINPEYFSVTFGAGGTTQESTLNTVLNIKKNDNITVAPHLSCIGSTKENILSLLNKYKEANINRLVALRGDIPSGMRHLGDFNYANELIEFIRKETGDFFNISVAAYPEFHPESKNANEDIEHFVNKIKTGANNAITQYFYNPDAYFRFIDEVSKKGVETSIVPGIMPITNYTQLMRFSSLCGAEIPKWISKRLEYYQNDLDSLEKFGFEVVSNLCQTLKNQGVEEFHFYSMNKTNPALPLAKALF